MGQTPKIAPIKSFAPRVRGVLLLPQRQGTPDNPLLGSLKEPEEIIKQGFLKKYVLALEAILGHPNIQPPREQYMIMQYKGMTP